MLTAEQILKSSDLGETEKVDVPEWGGHVYVRVMTGAERDRWEMTATKLVQQADGVNIRALFCSVVMCDENGNRLFNDSQASELGGKSAIALTRVFDKARKLNRVTDEDLEELEKN